MKKVTVLAVTLALSTSLCACGQKPAEQPDTEKEPQSNVQIANPVHEGTAEEVSAATGLTLTAPEKAENVRFSYIDGTYPAAQMEFELDGTKYVYRAQPAAKMEDISGMYFNWALHETANVSYCEAEINWNDGKEGVVTWFDIAPGINYALSVDQGAEKELLTETANLLFISTQGDADAEAQGFGIEFSALLKDIAENIHPGTAGTSLRYTAAAAKMADLFTTYSPSDQEIIGAMEGYLVTLDETQAAELITPLNNILGTFRELNGETKTEMLSACGYDAKYETWDYDTIERLFRVICSAVPVENMYAEIIDQYVDAQKSGADRQTFEDKNLNVMTRDVSNTPLETVGFLIDDLDGNGIRELVIGTMEGDSFFGKLVFDLYTLDEVGTPKLIFQSGERNRLYSAGSNVFANVGSNSATDSISTTLELKNGTLVDLEEEMPEAYYMQLPLTPLSNW